MPDAGLSIFIQVINAAGVPVLVSAIVILLRAYNKQSATYRETSEYLSQENTRLRLRLAEADASYTSELRQLRDAAARSADVVQRLEARKIALLSERAAGDEDTAAVYKDVARINEAIQAIRDLNLLQRSLDLNFHEQSHKTNNEMRELSTKIGELAQEVGDIKSRLTIVSVVTTTKIYEAMLKELGALPRGRTAPAHNEPMSGGEVIDAEERPLALPAAPTGVAFRQNEEHWGPEEFRELLERRTDAPKT